MIFGIKEMRDFASSHEDPRVVAIWLRLEETRNKTSKWCDRLVELKKANAKLCELAEYARHGGPRCDYERKCCCGLDELTDTLGLERIPLPYY